MSRQFDVVIERDEDGVYVASVPQLAGCHTQAASLDALMSRIREVIELCLQAESDPPRISSCNHCGMSRLPRLTGKALISVLAGLEFSVVRVKGGHHVLRYADGRQTVVPVHRGETISPGLMRKILRDIEVGADEFSRRL